MVGIRRIQVVGALTAVVLAAWLLPSALRAQPAGPTPSSITPPLPPPAARPSLPFVTYAAFFSQEAHRSPALDPHVFVKDDASAEGTGPENIAHVAGLRPARVDDAPEVVLYNANGDSLGFTLDRWFGASGTVDIDRGPAGATRLTLSFKKLIAFGIYSIFRATLSPDGTTFTPIDGDGSTNTFTSLVDGSANVVVSTPTPLGHANAIVLVLHSDSQEHGVSRGVVGVNAHQQLAVRIP